MVPQASLEDKVLKVMWSEVRVERSWIGRSGESDDIA